MMTATRCLLSMSAILLTSVGECRLGLLSAGVSAGVGSPSLLFSRLLVLYSLSVILYSSVLFLCVVFFVLCCVAWHCVIFPSCFRFFYLTIYVSLYYYLIVYGY